MNKFFKKLLRGWVERNFPKQFQIKITEKFDVRNIETVTIKKGKIKEVRSYDKNRKRLPKPIF